MTVGEIFRFLFKGELPIHIDPPLVEREGEPTLRTFSMSGVNPLYAAQPTNFGYRNKKDVKWYYCRDLFHADADRGNIKSRYLYCLGDRGPRRTVNLIRWVEDKLNLPDRGRGRTNIQIIYDWQSAKSRLPVNLLQIEPGLFWWDKMPHSFFTCLLRASTQTNEEDPIAMMKSYSYLASTWAYVEAFLDGKTKYIGSLKNVGWFERFRNATPQQVNTFLVKP